MLSDESTLCRAPNKQFVYIEDMEINEATLKLVLKYQAEKGLDEGAVASELNISPATWSAWKKRGRVSGGGLDWILKNRPDLSPLKTPDGKPLEPSEPSSIIELLEDLRDRIAKADPSIRSEISNLVSRYINSSEAGSRLANAIEALLVEDNDSSP